MALRFKQEKKSKTLLTDILSAMNNTLESSKLFPYIAWALVISFAVFTYALATRMQTELSDISVSVERLEAKIDNMGQKSR